LVMTSPSDIILLKWEGQEAAWIEITWIEIERTSTSIQRSNNTNVRFVHLFWRHERPWINRKVRNVNIRLDRTLSGDGKSHICVIETTSFQREDFMTHGRHLNSRGKRSLHFLLLRV
jgi:hypothetical protein